MTNLLQLLLLLLSELLQTAQLLVFALAGDLGSPLCLLLLGGHRLVSPVVPGRPIVVVIVIVITTAR